MTATIKDRGRQTFITELSKRSSITELKDELSKERFGKAYKDCKYEQKEAIDKAIPTSISEAEPKSVGGIK